MDFNKYQKGDTVKVLKHNLRRFSDGKSASNKDIIPELTYQNYSIIDRGNSVKEVKEYFDQLEKNIFHYDRKDVVHSVEWIVTMPKDCPTEDERHFFETAHHFFADLLCCSLN